MENKSPLVTIVVISYNQAKYIEENLNSIKTQTYQNIELIVADDASTDNSLKVFDTWLKQNNYTAKKNYHTKNTGLATVLNECIEMATGKYIKLIAADDYFEKQYIEKCVKLLLEKNADIVFTNALEIDEKSNVLNSFYFNIPIYNSIVELEKLLMERNFISGATLMTSRDLYKVIGNYDSKVMLEDYNLVLNTISKDIHIHYINENLINYRRHGGNITIVKSHILSIETIKEKLRFDSAGKYNALIHFNIRQEIKLDNSYLKNLNKFYLNYKGFNWKFYLFYFYSLFTKFLKKRCFQS